MKQNAKIKYQFRYVTKRNIIGNSNPFRIYDEALSDDETNLELIERHIEGAGSMTLIRSNILNPTGLFFNFLFLKAIKNTNKFSQAC